VLFFLETDTSSEGSVESEIDSQTELSVESSGASDYSSEIEAISELSTISPAEDYESKASTIESQNSVDFDTISVDNSSNGNYFRQERLIFHHHVFDVQCVRCADVFNVSVLMY